MAKESVKVKASLENVLNAIDTYKRDNGSLPEHLECNVETYRDLHKGVMLSFGDKELDKLVNDRGLKAKASYLTRVHVNPAREIAVAF